MKKQILLFIILIASTIIQAQTCDEKLSFALEFNGSNQYAIIPDRAALNAPNSAAITIEMWIRPKDITTNTYSSIYRKENDGVGRQLIAFQNDNVAGTVNGVATTTSLTFGLETIASGYQELDVLINPADFVNKWNHIAAVYDGAAMRLYVNGTEIGNIPALNFIKQPTISRPVYLASFDGTSELYNGRIDQVRMWSIALNSTQLNAIKDSCTNFATLTANADTSKLLTYLKFGDDGTHLNDEVFTSNITLHNNPQLQPGFYTDEFKLVRTLGSCNGFVEFRFGVVLNWTNGFFGSTIHLNDNLLIRPSNPTVFISDNINVDGKLTVLNGGLTSSCRIASSYFISSTGIFIQDSPNFSFTISTNTRLDNSGVFRLTDNANMTINNGGRMEVFNNSKTYLESTQFRLDGNLQVNSGATIYTKPSFNMSGSGTIVNKGGIFKNDVTFPSGVNYVVDAAQNTFEANVSFEGTISFDISSPTSFDKINIGDKGTFGHPTLNVTQIGNNIKVGDRFKIIEATNGFNGPVNLGATNLPPNFTWNIEYNPNDITLVATGCTTADTTAPIVSGLTDYQPIFYQQQERLQFQIIPI